MMALLFIFQEFLKFSSLISVVIKFSDQKQLREERIHFNLQIPGYSLLLWEVTLTKA